MKIYTQIVINMKNGAVLLAKSMDWSGDVCLCKGGGSSTTVSNTTSTPDYEYNKRIAGVAERQQSLADTYFKWWQEKQAPVEEATLKSQAELLPLQTQVSKEGLEGYRGVQSQFYKMTMPKSSALAAGQAATDVNQAMSNATGTLNRDMARLGISPGSGAAQSSLRNMALQGAAMKAGAANTARQQNDDMNLQRLSAGMQFGQA